MVTHNGRVTDEEYDAQAHAERQARASVFEYERELDDKQMVALAVDLARRGEALQSQGIFIDMVAIANHHLIGLLEFLVGEDEADRIKEWHLSFVDRHIDQQEARARAALLTRLDDAGIFTGDLK